MEVGSVRLMVLVIMKRLFCCWRSVHLKNCWSIWNCATCRIISSDRKQAVFFARAEINMGVEAFRDSLYSLLKRNTFLNIKFENMLDTLGEISRTDIRSLLGEWEKTTPLPFYSLGEPTLTKITNKGGEEFLY